MLVIVQSLVLLSLIFSYFTDPNDSEVTRMELPVAVIKLYHRLIELNFVT
jgi:hypothetical protein